jgi:hypothetical protein
VEAFKPASTWDNPLAESESYITTDGQSASLSWNKAPTWGLRLDFYYCQTVMSLLMWGALSDKRTGLSFTIAAGARQRSLSLVRFPWDSRQILLSQIRDFPFRRLLRLAGSRWRYSIPPSHGRLKVRVMLGPTVQLASLSWNKAPIWGLRPNFYYVRQLQAS